MQTITNISVETGKECKVDVEILHETLEMLPANIYLDLFRRMHIKIYGYPAYVAWNGGCCGTIEDKSE